jgi:hypothetical protein
MKTVYWASVPEITNDNITKVSELKYSNPVSIFKDLTPKEFFGPNAGFCPAIINEGKNTFKINSPIDLDVTFSEDFTGIQSKYSTDFDFIKHFIGPFGPDKVVQLSSPTYLFFCEESLTMTQLPPYYEQSDFVKNCMGLSATFNINSWFRVVKPAFKLRNDSRRINFDTNTALMYLRFNTEEKIKLVRFDASSFYKENKDIMEGIQNFKYHTKNPLIPTKLSEGYRAFLNSRYKKRIIKIINDNIID